MSSFGFSIYLFVVSLTASSGSRPRPPTRNIKTQPLLNTLRWDIATFILGALGLMIAAAGGIGGGGILVPIYILVLNFSPKYAVPLSNITIFGGAITNTFLNMKKRHPMADRPLVDWDLILVMEPLTSESLQMSPSFSSSLLLSLMLWSLLSVRVNADDERRLWSG